MEEQNGGSIAREAIANGLATLNGLPVPAPIQKSFLKAVSRLTGALIDIPAAKLESYAEDIRAATEARKHLTLHAADALADEFKSSPHLAVRAQARATAKILREQVNVEDILRMAAEDLVDSEVEEEPASEPDLDWWNVFEEEAANKSSDEMKTVFGKILAGELVRPGSFSIRAIRSVGEMDSGTAAIFAKLCSLSLGSGIEARVVSVGGNAANNALQKFGLSYGALQILEQHGLIDSDFNNWRDYAQLAFIPFPIDYVGRTHRLARIRDGADPLKLQGVSLTKIGRELRQIVNMTEEPTYTSALADHLKNAGYVLVPAETQ